MTGQLAAVKIVSKKTAHDARSHSILAMEKLMAKHPQRTNQRRIPVGINREIVVMKIIEHPNIIQVFDVWENRGELYVLRAMGPLYSLLIRLGISYSNW